MRLLFHRAARGLLFAVAVVKPSHPISYLVPGSISGIILVAVVPGAMWYHEGTSIFFALPCGRVPAESMLAQANLGSTAAVVTLPAATAVEHCEPLLCVCSRCR